MAVVLGARQTFSTEQLHKVGKVLPAAAAAVLALVPLEWAVLES